MKFTLGIRELTEQDLRAECPTIPDADEIEIYINAFVEDINNFTCVEQAKLIESTVAIDLCDEKDIGELHKSLVNTNAIYLQKFRTTGLSKVKE